MKQERDFSPRDDGSERRYLVLVYNALHAVPLNGTELKELF